MSLLIERGVVVVDGGGAFSEGDKGDICESVPPAHNPQWNGLHCSKKQGHDGAHQATYKANWHSGKDTVNWV